MSKRLDGISQIWRSAADLGLPSSASPSRRIRDIVMKRIRQIATKFRCASLDDLLSPAAAASLAAGLLLATALSVAKAQEVPRDSRAPVHRESDSGAPLVIQGRITSIEGALLTVKTPDGYPGGPGGHPEFVLAGSTFKADVSRARVLLPDGRRADTQPLAVGDRVLIVLSSSHSGSPEPNFSVNIKRIYTASIVERLVVGDKVITH